jgi:DNA-binding CsgD family transcriptional regulator
LALVRSTYRREGDSARCREEKRREEKRREEKRTSSSPVDEPEDRSVPFHASRHGGTGRDEGRPVGQDLTRRIVWRVVSPHARDRTQMEQYLLAGGHLIQTDGPPTADDLLGIVLAEFEITGREYDVLRELTLREHTREIADALFISEDTVQKHLQSLMQKLRVHTRHRLIVEALRIGLLVLPKDT